MVLTLYWSHQTCMFPGGLGTHEAGADESHPYEVTLQGISGSLASQRGQDRRFLLQRWHKHHTSCNDDMTVLSSNTCCVPNICPATAIVALTALPLRENVKRRRFLSIGEAADRGSWRFLLVGFWRTSRPREVFIRF